MFRLLIILLVVSLLVSCSSQNSPLQTTFPQTSATATPARSQEPPSPVPSFEHIVIIVMENKGFNIIFNNPEMPVFNRMAQDYTLLTQFYAVQHPSLPNYIAMIGGETFNITNDCTDCFIDARSLPDLIEARGLSWKTYQESIPSPCYVGNNLLFRAFKNRYAQKHNPFVYFDPIRKDKGRCLRSVVPLTDLGLDITTGTLPNFMFITPNMCNIGHDCSLSVTNNWLENQLNDLLPALDKTGKPYLVVLTFDEGDDNTSCCGLPDSAGGRIPVVLISPSVKNGFQDVTPYSHYSLLKTISAAWGLDYLGHAADDSTPLIIAPWK